MKKYKTLLLVALLSFVMFTTNIKANEIEAKDSFNNFIVDLNNGDREAYSYISSESIRKEVDKYLGNIEIKYAIKDVKKTSDGYNIKFTFAANGIGWNVNGFTANVTLKEYNGEYKITDTNFFDKVGTKSILKFMAIIFGIVISTFAVILAITLIVIQLRKKSRNN